AGDLNDPATYAAWAQSYEDAYCFDSPEADDRVLPLRLLNDLQRQAPEAVSADLLQKILDNPARCAPIFRSALHEWTMYPDIISPEAIGLVVAFIGEQSGPEILPDLIAFAPGLREHVFLNAEWAIWRLGQRFPAETLAAFRSAAVDSE